VRGALLRRWLARLFAGQSELVLESRAPTKEELCKKFEEIEELGVYLHIPFCRQICPYCPYNKELLNDAAADRYASAVKREIDFYADVIGGRPVTSLYIGGGTPTTMLQHGLPDILDHLHHALSVQCSIHMEAHLNDLSPANLDLIKSLGIQHVSVGVEALQDKHLQFLERPYTANTAKTVIARALGRGFQCFNVDLMFALPGQDCREVEEAARIVTDLGVDQVAAYPLFHFPYTRMGSNGQANNYGWSLLVKRRQMLKVLEAVFYSSGYQRSSVWAFTKSGIPKYCSVTVPLYVGLGASGGSYLRDVFYLNTFSVAEYIMAMEQKGTAVALSLDLTEQMQMAGWLYWRIYETEFKKQDFSRRFGRDIDRVYGRYLRMLRLTGFAKDDGDRIVLTDKGAYWLHALEDVLSLGYVSRLWGTSKQEPWPTAVAL
jgi:oxygen-independent coproporphyrinogen-3 oxidase